VLSRLDRMELYTWGLKSTFESQLHVRLDEYAGVSPRSHGDNSLLTTSKRSPGTSTQRISRGDHQKSVSRKNQAGVYVG